jgi:F-box domain
MQLNDISIPNDISIFPIELLLCIAQHLDLREIIILRFVSRTWNKIFSSADFSIGVIKRHFRPVWEVRFRCLTAAQQVAEKNALSQWLPEAARDRIRRQQGRYQSMSIYRQSRYTILDWQYKNGRIAFRHGPGAIVVRQLCTDQTATYVDDNRVHFVKWHLSDEFLLVAKNGP